MIEDRALADVEPAERDRPEGDGPDVVGDFFEANELPAEEAGGAVGFPRPPAARFPSEVFDPDGEWLGSVRLPDPVKYSGYATTEAAVIRGDTMWAVYRDSLDVEKVGRFELRWPKK